MKASDFARIAPVLLLTACATVPPGPPILPPNAACNADGLDRFVGQPANVEVAAQILDASGARTFRWTGPGIAVTMDLRADRVNADLDESLSRIDGISCG